MTIDRRVFLGQVSALAVGVTIGPDELHATSSRIGGPWDTSWLDRLAAAQYRVVFNTSEVSDGNVLSYASSFLDDFRTVHGTTDQQTRPVVVFRRLGTPMALNDALWERYAIGEDQKIKDPNTKVPATRNVFWKARDGATGWEAQYALATELSEFQKNAPGLCRRSASSLGLCGVVRLDELSTGFTARSQWRRNHRLEH